MSHQFRSVLETVAHELSRLARMAEEVQAAALPCSLSRRFRWTGEVRDGSVADDGAIAALQSLDYLTQALDCLSRFMAASADVAPTCETDLSEALGAVWLAELAARLEGCDRSVPVAGELELFEQG